MVAPIFFFKSRISVATSSWTVVAVIGRVPCFSGGGGTTHALCPIIRPPHRHRAGLYGNDGSITVRRPLFEDGVPAHGRIVLADSGSLSQPVQQPGADGHARQARD